MTPSEPEVLPAVDTENGLFSEADATILQETRRIRQSMIQELAKDNPLPQEKSDRVLLAALLSDQESAVMGKTRLKVQAKTNEAVTNLTGAIGQALAQHKVIKPARTHLKDVELPSHIQLTDLVPGEMDVGNLPLKLTDLKS